MGGAGRVVHPRDEADKGRSRFPEGMTERKARATTVPVGTRIRWQVGVNWRDESENVFFGEFLGGDGLCGWWADCGSEAADDVRGFDGDEAGE